MTMMSFSRTNKDKVTNGSKSSPSSNSSTDELKFAKIIADAIRDAFLSPLGGGKEPNALAGLAISLAGDGLKFPVGEGLADIAVAADDMAEALGDVAKALHRIADAVEKN